MEKIVLADDSIQLDQFLKLAGALPTGGAVKPLLAEGKVYQNGEKESARRRKLHPGDVIRIEGLGEWQFVRGTESCSSEE